MTETSIFGRGAHGRHRIMERSQEAIIITQEDLIVTLVGGGRRMEQGHQILNIYISTTESFI